MPNTCDVLVIDDEPERLDPLVTSLRQALGAGVNVRRWQPKLGENSVEQFASEIASGVALIATDQDLTKGGFLGSFVTTGAQDKFIPVCNFSRHRNRILPREKNFFELRVPPKPNEDARASYIARIYRGFEQIRTHIARSGAIKPTAQLLAEAIAAPELEDDLAPFLSSVASVTSAFMQGATADKRFPDDEERSNLVTFILGHVLVNGVLEYPGPILSRATLAAYCAVGGSMEDQLADLFSDAAYVGPFSEPDQYFQRRLVDRKIDSLAEKVADESDEPDIYTRAVIVQALGGAAPHDCDRCGGTRGGYWCPFTKRAVCSRRDCSVASSTWIPRGATLCRVEHDYFEELAPLVGE